MGVESKYYTPTIEEFHVGFEYERCNKPFREGFDKMIFTEQDMFNDSFMYHFNVNDTRVKHLDREDIESLGWCHDQTTKDGAYFYYGTLMTTKEFMLTCPNARLSKGENYTVLDITSLRDHITDSFNGTIKNKSELKRLMKQLGIND